MVHAFHGSLGLLSAVGSFFRSIPGKLQSFAGPGIDGQHGLVHLFNLLGSALNILALILGPRCHLFHPGTDLLAGGGQLAAGFADAVEQTGQLGCHAVKGFRQGAGLIIGQSLGPVLAQMPFGYTLGMCSETLDRPRNTVGKKQGS